MSVTFTIESIPTGKFQVECLEHDEIVAVADSYDTAGLASLTHQAACEDCAVYLPAIQAVVDVQTDLDVNMSNTNAMGMLERLDLLVDPQDLAGTVEAGDFLARVVMAQALLGDDSGVRPTEDRTAGGATWIDCGLREGYWGESLGRLEALAMEAVRLGREIWYS